MKPTQPTLALLIFLMVSLGMAGCGPGEFFGPTLTLLPTITGLPSLTPTFTPTFTPTITASPTFTPTPTIEAPSQLAGFFEGAALTYYESFDTIPLDQWNKQPCQTISNGELVYVCTDGYFGRKNTYALHEGQGILIDFKHPSQADTYYWSIDLSTGSVGKIDWKIFGISEDDTKGQGIGIYQGSTSFGLTPNWTKPDVWYRLALALDSTGKIAVLVWERDNPKAQVLNYINGMGPGWSGQHWLFWVNNRQSVALNLDNYYEFSFTRIK